jgi:LEA14-like dessication related protein
MKTLSFLLFLFLFSSCATFEDPVEVVSYDMKMENLNLDEAALRFNTTIHNNTWTPIKIKPSTLELYVDGEKLGDVYLDEKIRLKSNKDNEVNTLVYVKFADGILGKLIRYRFKETAQLELRGKVKTGLLFVPIKIPVNYSKVISPKNLNLNLDNQ